MNLCVCFTPLVAYLLQVITPNEKAGLEGHMTTESPYMMMMQASHDDKVAWKTEWNVDTLDRSLSAVTSYSKGINNCYNFNSTQID